MFQLSNFEPKSKKIDQRKKWAMEKSDVRQRCEDAIIPESPLHLLSVLGNRKYLPYLSKYVTRTWDNSFMRYHLTWDY